MIELDRESLLVHVASHERLADLEVALSKDGLTLDLSAIPDRTVAAWLESGAENARSAWLDPADHLVAGFTANGPTGSFTIRPAPRRAVGPDLLALVLGVRGLLKLESVWLRVHRRDVTRPVAKFDGRDEHEPLTKDEAALYDAIKTALFR